MADTPLLELREVSKSFGRLQVIDRLSFGVARGEALGVLGPNGAGKTTLFNLIGGEYPLAAGRVLFKGRDISGAPAQDRCRAGIGRTYQIPRPFVGMTVFENVLVGATYGRGRRINESQEWCWEILSDTGLLDKRAVLAGRLSLLERKRLDLARALAASPELLLLDEIAGGLTEPEVHQLLELLAAVRARGVTIVWIEHIIHALAALADRILAINFGTKLIEGPTREVLASRELQEVYLGVE